MLTGGTAHGGHDLRVDQRPQAQHPAGGLRHPAGALPHAARCMAEQAPVFLSRQAPIDLDGESEETAPWYFVAVPLIRDQQPEGFLCIENAREHPEDAALFSTLIPLHTPAAGAVRPGGALRGSRGAADGPAGSAGLYAGPLHPHLGALQLPGRGVPGYPRTSPRSVAASGLSTGAGWLWYVAGTLTDLFGGALLFRTWESQFIRLLSPTPRGGLSGPLRQTPVHPSAALSQAGAHRPRLGGGSVLRQTSGGGGAGRHAGGKGPGPPAGSCFPSGQEDASPWPEAPVRAVRGPLSAQDRYAHRSPDRRGGAGTGGGGGRLRRPPSRFIELLEEDGTIRDLDLFVLEQALSQAEQWRAEGLHVVPLAVNISRATLAHPSTLASVLAIQSRYPQLPPQTLELGDHGAGQYRCRGVPAAGGAVSRQRDPDRPG